MKVKWQGRTTDGRYSLQAYPSAYDGVPPVDSFYIENQPLFFNDDILAVVGILLFGEYTSGIYEPPKSVSPEVAEAIQLYLNPRWVGISEVKLEPVANPPGDGIIIASDSLDLWGKHSSEWGMPRVSTVCSLPSSEFSGSLASVDGIMVASNGNLIGKFSQREDGLLPTLATSLLYCESYRAQSIVLDQSFQLSDSEFEKLYNLLASCKISLKEYRALTP